MTTVFCTVISRLRGASRSVDSCFFDSSNERVATREISPVVDRPVLLGFVCWNRIETHARVYVYRRGGKSEDTHSLDGGLVIRARSGNRTLGSSAPAKVAANRWKTYWRGMRRILKHSKHAWENWWWETRTDSVCSMLATERRTISFPGYTEVLGNNMNL